MSSLLCFICHSTINSETSEETREKYREVVGMNLSPDSQLCHICCHVLNKLSLFRSICLKRSLEYPVLFSEKGTLNLQRSNTEVWEIVSPENCCDDYQTSSKSFQFTHNWQDSHSPNNDYAKEEKAYVSLEDNFYQIENNNCPNEIEKSQDEVNTDGEIFKINDYQINKTVQDEFIDLEKKVSCPVNDYDDNFYQQDADDNIKLDCNSDVNNTENHGDYDEDNDILIGNDSHGEDYDENEIMDNDLNQEEKNDELKTKEVVTKVKKKDSKRKKIITLTFEEQKAELEARRKEKKYMEAIYKCYNCALPFLYKDTYQAHMMRHEESNGEHQCAVCTLRFASLRGLRKHAILHSRRCGCGASLRRCRCGSDARPPQCVACHLCGNLLKDAGGLQQHLRRVHPTGHTGRVHSCAVCGDSLPTQRQLRTHMLKHINRKFHCDQCPAVYSSPYTLAQHRRAHSEPPGEPQRCGACGQQCRDRRSLLQHRRSHRRPLLECQVCGRACAGARSLALHVQAIHSGSKDHECPHCNARYSTRRSLLRHVAEHTQKKPPKIAICHLCGKHFKGQSKLNRHLKNVCEKVKLEEQLAELYE